MTLTRRGGCKTFSASTLASQSTAFVRRGQPLATRMCSRLPKELVRLLFDAFLPVGLKAAVRIVKGVEGIIQLG